MVSQDRFAPKLAERFKSCWRMTVLSTYFGVTRPQIRSLMRVTLRQSRVIIHPQWKSSGRSTALIMIHSTSRDRMKFHH